MLAPDVFVLSPSRLDTGHVRTIIGLDFAPGDDSFVIRGGGLFNP